nr:hypothetical protein Ade03nite_89280 [Actinoplanes derwentensis]
MALVRANFPELSAEEVVHRITATADDNGPAGKDDQCGYGVLNVVKALTAEVAPLTPAASTATSVAPTGPAAAAPKPSQVEAAPEAEGSSSAAVVGIGTLVAVLAGLLAFVIIRNAGRPHR